MKTLCVLGSINVDHVIRVPYFPQAGETLAGYGYQLVYGGKGANQAVAAARLGAKVQLIGAIGDDAIGRTMQSAFEREGIDTQAMVCMAGQTTGLAMIQVSDAGENSIVIAAGANADLSVEHVQAQSALLENADGLLLQLETPLASVVQAAKIAHAAGVRVVLNPAPAQSLPDELLACVDIITPDETEAEILTDIPVRDEASALAAAQALHRRGIETVLITLGAKGVLVSERGRDSKVVAGFRVEAVDSTAAGDTFNGALVTALLEGKALWAAVELANAAAAISVTRLGAQTAIPTRAEVEAFLAAHAR